MENNKEIKSVGQEVIEWLDATMAKDDGHTIVHEWDMEDVKEKINDLIHEKIIQLIKTGK